MTLWSRTAFLAAVAVSALAQSSSSLAHLRAGEALLNQRNFQQAALEFNQAIHGDHQPAWTLVWGFIDLGRAFDAAGQRERAVEAYDLAIETGDNTFAALDIANTYILKAPSIDQVSSLPGDPARTSPIVLNRIEPVYSTEALLARLEGSVTIAVSVTQDGGIGDVHVLKPLGLGLDGAALRAVQLWKFAPATYNKKPVQEVIPVAVDFRLASEFPGWHVTRIDFTVPEGAARPNLIQTGPFTPGKMGSDLAEEAMIDAAVSRIPTATIAFEIDTQGNPSKIQINAASLSIWGEDAVRTLREWRFSPGRQREIPIAVPCVVELGWFAPVVEQTTSQRRKTP